MLAKAKQLGDARADSDPFGQPASDPGAVASITQGGQAMLAESEALFGIA